MNSGKTWFNKLGYHQTDYDNKVKKHSITINKNFFDLINSILFNINNLSDREINYLFDNLLPTYKVINKYPKNIDNKIEIIANCIQYLLISIDILLIDEYDNIIDVGHWLKNTKDITNNNALFYLKNIILACVGVILKNQWDNDVFYIKYL